MNSTDGFDEPGSRALTSLAEACLRLSFIPTACSSIPIEEWVEGGTPQPPDLRDPNGWDPSNRGVGGGPVGHHPLI
ncbi:hypothetical protein CRG98_009587 [Punica granatum]|uniref:Uncharacterized protein n=1 Tax=Punica granatum TaxID=22663 RepID=A0A2I0KNC0_PUNGR|nr:hypothetical protein CRG98_009587 [Punica granatum]